MGAAEVSDGSAAGKVLPFMWVYGSRPSSSRFSVPDALVAALLHDQALEELAGAALEQEVATDRVAEGGHAAAMREVVPEGVAVDAEAGLREHARIGLRPVSWAWAKDASGEAMLASNSATAMNSEGRRFAEARARVRDVREPTGQEMISDQECRRSWTSPRTILSTRRRSKDVKRPFSARSDEP